MIKSFKDFVNEGALNEASDVKKDKGFKTLVTLLKDRRFTFKKLNIKKMPKDGNPGELEIECVYYDQIKSDDYNVVLFADFVPISDPSKGYTFGYQFEDAVKIKDAIRASVLNGLETTIENLRNLCSNEYW